jgi:hypothetical protein
MSWEDTMVLGKDEKVVHNWHGNYEFGKTVMVQKGGVSLLQLQGSLVLF